jgi:hypothetical protein
MRRSTPHKMPETKYAQRIEWTAMRSIKQENPINMKGLALIALRMKATDQFNGFPDQINCIAESYLPTYNGTSWAWEVSRNPAWAYADLMRRRGTDRLIHVFKRSAPSELSLSAGFPKIRSRGKVGIPISNESMARAQQSMGMSLAWTRAVPTSSSFQILSAV